MSKKKQNWRESQLDKNTSNDKVISKKETIDRKSFLGKAGKLIAVGALAHFSMVGKAYADEPPITSCITPALPPPCEDCQHACNLECQEPCQDGQICELECQDGCEVACQECNTCQEACQALCQNGVYPCSEPCEMACQTCQDECQIFCQTCEAICQLVYQCTETCEMEVQFIEL